MYYSPKTSADGLVFHYDTGNTVRSYKGEPTTNLNPYTLSDSGTDGSGQGSVGTRTLLSANHVRIVDVDSNTRQTHLIQGLTGGTTYTISVEFKKLSGTPTFRFQIQDHSGGSFLRTIKFTNTAEIGIEDIDGWQTASWTFTLGGDANAVRIWYQDGADYTTYTHAFELRNPQLEAKSHPTPFTPPSTTRSATQGLLNLAGTSTIDLSNVSFDSNAQMTFDGTNDAISVNTPASFDSSTSWTIETCFKITGAPSSTAYMNVIVDMNPTGGSANMICVNWSDMRLQYRSRPVGGSYTDINGSILSQNTWYSATVVRDSTNSTKLYLNGIQDGGTYSGNLPNGHQSTFNIGRWTDGTVFANATIPLVKIYNRALTADQVARNFNAIKSRFNIG